MKMFFQSKRSAKLLSVVLSLLMIFACMPVTANAAYGGGLTNNFTVYVVGKDGTDTMIGQWEYDGTNHTLTTDGGIEPSFISSSSLVYSGQDAYTSCARIGVVTKYISLDDLIAYTGTEMGCNLGDEASIAFKAADGTSYGELSVYGEKYGLNRYYYPSYIINQTFTTSGGIVPTVLAIDSWNTRNNDSSKGITADGGYVISNDTTLINGILRLEGIADDTNALRIFMGQQPNNSTELNLGGESLKWISDVRIAPVYNSISFSTPSGITATMDDGYLKAASGEPVSFTLDGIPNGKRAEATITDADGNSYATTRLGNTFSFTMPAKAATINVSLSSCWDRSTVDVSWYNTTDTTFSISTPEQLMGLAAIVNGGVDSTVTTITGNGGVLPTQDSFKGKTVKLSADLDMGGIYNSTNGTWCGPNYMPIGGQWRLVTGVTTDANDVEAYTYSTSIVGSTLGASFNGNFNGNGHLVKNINCQRQTDMDCQAVGLIGRLGAHDSDAEALRPVNPTVSNVGITGYIQGGRSIGGIVGKTGKTAYNNTTASAAGIGCTIENCVNYATVYATQKKGVGGIAGAAWNGGIIENCANLGKVSNSGANPTGGIAGSLEFPAVNCYNTGIVTASSSSYAMALGTIAASNACFVNCYWLDGSAAGGGIYSSTSKDSAVSKTAAELKSSDFITALNATGSAFVLDSTKINNGYPILSWQAPASTGGSGTGGSSSGGGGGTASGSDDTKIVSSSTGDKTAVAVANVSATTDSNGTATVTVKSGVLNSALSSAKAAAAAADTKAGKDEGTTAVEVNLEVATASNATAIQTTLPMDTLKEMAADENTSLKISSDVADITLDQEALAAILDQAGGKVTISAKKIETSALPTEAQEEVGTSPVYDLNVLGSNGTVSDFKKGSVTVSIPYTLKDGESASQVTVYYINDAGELKEMNCTYDESTKTATFRTNHFSYYAVMIKDGAAMFHDISQSAYYYDAVNYAVKQGLFNGTSETSFSPSAGMTRAMFVTVLGRANDVDTAVYSNSTFGDVSSDSWYGSYVQWAYETGIVSGMSKSQFAPDQQITRDQMATILTNYCKWKGISIADTTQLTYTDLSAVPAWAVEGVTFCTAKGWLTGYTDGSFQGQRTASRAEAATVLYKGNETMFGK